MSMCVFPLRAIKLCVILTVFVFLTACQRAEPSRAELALGTVCFVTLYDQAKNQVYEDIFSRLCEIENRMSVNLCDSDISLINAAAGLESVQVHGDVFEVIERSVHFAKLSGGAFDPTVGPLVTLWGIGEDNPRIPSQAEIDAVLPLINWQDIELDRDKRSVFLKKPGMALDLGAIAKGYAADEAVATIRKANLKRALIDFGGNIFVYGEKRNKSPWRVGIQNPLDDRGAYIGVVETREKTIVTSGVYERNFEDNGILYHHLFSPSNGYPANNGLLSVTIIGDVSMDADALSTAVFVLGYEKGLALLESFRGFEAVFVFEDKSVRKTSEVNFILTDDSYRLE